MSKLIDELSAPSTKTELDLFTVPPTQVAIRKSFWSEIQLQNPCTNTGPYEFKISPDSFMLDMSKNYIYFRIRIIKDDGAVCSSIINKEGAVQGDKVVPINLLAKTFFKQMKIFLNAKLISDSGDKYAYRALLESKLNFDDGNKKTQLQAAGYYKDSNNLNLMENGSLQYIYDRFKSCQWVELMAPIHADLFLQERYLLNQCDLRLEMYRNTDNFCLIDLAKSDNNYKIEVQDMKLFIKKVEIAESISLAIENMLSNTSAKYPIRRTQLTTIHITENRRSTPLNSLFNGPSPRRIVVGMVKAEASRGSNITSPFNFENFGISEIKITSGTVTVPSTPDQLNFDANLYIRAFAQMFEGLGIAGNDKGNAITLQDFKNGSTFFVFELGADGADDSYWELIREATTSLEILFGKPLPEGGVECIIYAEFDSLLMIDHTRQAYMDYTI